MHRRNISTDIVFLNELKKIASRPVLKELTKSRYKVKLDEVHEVYDYLDNQWF